MRDRGGRVGPLDFGAHLPLMDFGGHPYTYEHLADYTRTAARLGFHALSVNDHMVFSVPWLDGPTALAAMLEHSGDMTLATTVSLPVVRGPVPLAKTLAAIDRLSDGRLVVAVGPGSSEPTTPPSDIDFSERWVRLDEAIGTLRALWRSDAGPFAGRFYSTEGIDLDPHPARAEGPPIWVGSWGSEAGLRRTAGWPTAGWPPPTTPLRTCSPTVDPPPERPSHGKDPAAFPNALATMWFFITDDPEEADRVMRERVVPTIHRPEEVLRERLPIGPPSCSRRSSPAFAAGVQQVYIWPVADEARQIELFWKVRPAVIG